MVKEGERKTKQSTYHFTIIDTKPQVIARAMLVFLLLEELTDKRSLNKEKAEEILATLFYTFMNHIMPPQAYKKLQMTISKAIRLLEQPTTTLSWFDVLQKDRGAVIEALKLWQLKTSQMFSTNTFRMKIAIDTANQSMSQWTPEPGDMPPLAKGLAKDKILYDRAGITLPPPSFSNQDPIKVRELVADKSFPKNITASWLSKLDSTWMPNVTLIDVEQVNQQAKAGIPIELMDIDLATDLFAQWADYIQTPHPRNPKCLYDYGEGYFLILASALTHLKGRLRVEPILGEMCETFEKMRLGVYTDRKDKPVPGQTEDSRGKFELYTLASETGEERSYMLLVVLVGDMALSAAAISSGSGHARVVSVSGRRLGVVMGNWVGTWCIVIDGSNDKHLSADVCENHLFEPDAAYDGVSLEGTPECVSTPDGV